MAELTIQQRIWAIEALLNDFYAKDGFVSSLIKEGASKGLRAWNSDYTPDILALQKAMSVITGKLQTDPAIKDYVDPEFLKQLTVRVMDITEEFNRINDAWIKSPYLTSIKVAIIHWKDAPVGKYAYNATRIYLTKLRESDIMIKKIKDILVKFEPYRNDFISDVKTTKIYDELRNELAEAEKIRSWISINPDDPQFKELLGGITTTIQVTGWTVAVVAAGVIILILGWKLISSLEKAKYIDDRADQAKARKTEAQVAIEQRTAPLKSELNKIDTELQKRGAGVKGLGAETTGYESVPTPELLKKRNEIIGKMDGIITEENKKANEDIPKLPPPMSFEAMALWAVGILGAAYAVSKAVPAIVSRPRGLPTAPMGQPDGVRRGG